MNPLFTEVETVMDQIRVRNPSLYKLAVPRRIIPPHNFANPRLYGPFIVAGAYNSSRGWEPNDSTAPSQVVLASILAKFKLPTYFVSEDFCRAVAATEPPKDTPLAGINWPMPAMLFVLPLSFSKEYCGAVAPFLSIARCPIGAYAVGSGKFGVELREEERVMVHSMVFHGISPVDYLNVTRMSKTLDALECAQFTAWDQDLALREKYHPESFNCPSKESEVTIANKLNALATKLLLAISVRPELREEGCLQRPARVRDNVVEREELWSPNIIGRSYRIIYGPGHKPDGTHSSPKMHWRRGFMRNQKFGHALSQSRLIWIDPVLVNSETK